MGKAKEILSGQLNLQVWSSGKERAGNIDLGVISTLVVFKVMVRGLGN